MEYPAVAIAAPVRNRAWVLPHYLDALARLDWPVPQLEFGFVVNDSTDMSQQLLDKFLTIRQGMAWTLNVGTPPDWGLAPDGTHTPRRGYDRTPVYRALALLRNVCIEWFLNYTTAEYLWFVDSDIGVPADGLAHLMAVEKRAVSAVVDNGHGATNVMVRDPDTGRYRHLLIPPTGPPMACDLTGAVFLLRREVLAQGVRYAFTHRGEDEGFAESARAHGVDFWTVPECRPVHYIEQEMLA